MSAGSVPAWRVPVVHGGLLLATLVSTTTVFYFTATAEPDGLDRLVEALFFSVPALLILGAHEMGHFLMARHHGVETSWPYFLPSPFAFGTFGAVIRLKGRIPSRNALLDIGAAGPLAGLLVALPMLVVGVQLSHVMPAPLVAPFPPNLSLLGLAAEAGHWMRHQLDGTSPAPQTMEYAFYGDNLLTWGLTRLRFGRLPAGSDLFVHPVFMAAWFGMLVTMLNLLPVGQLDGGHVLRALLGKRAEQLGPHLASALLILALLGSFTWLVWFFLVTRVVGFGHPPPDDDQTPLSRGRVVVAGFCALATLLCFMPVPVDLLAG
jgi:membrane-associated protease RseP (regulator of RpoE activity)